MFGLGVWSVTSSIAATVYIINLVLVQFSVEHLWIIFFQTQSQVKRHFTSSLWNSWEKLLPNRNFVHRIIYSMNFFCLFYVRLLFISMHLSHNSIQILLYLKSVCLILTHIHFGSHSNWTLHWLVTIFKAQVCAMKYFFSTSQFSWKQVYDHTLNTGLLRL